MPSLILSSPADFPSGPDPGPGLGPSATDIITYIGVPLAVLGVLPILYNTAVTLAARSKIKRMLRLSRLTGLTRSDIINRVIEVDLPRYAVKPWDRFVDRDEYWTLPSHPPSSIPGGSWTTFNWRTNVIGLHTQRVEYADQLRQPQVEVNFDELVAYLLDLGAVPDASGWRLLRATGLWTPVNYALMHVFSPDGTDKEKVLTIGSLEGADGHLSLRVRWKKEWTTRDCRNLPPYWVNLPAPPTPDSDSSPEEDTSGSDRKPSLEDDSAAGSNHKPELRDSNVHGHGPITCQISSEGITTALTHEDQIQSTINLDGLPIDHLRIRPSFSSSYPPQSSPSSSSSSESPGTWFASASTALGTTSQTILWSYRIPDSILSFCRRETVPCGVLVLLGVVDESVTPDWSSTKHHDDLDVVKNLEQFARRTREQREAMMQEQKMPAGPEKDKKVRERLAREGRERVDDMREKFRLETQRKETRLMEAFQSPKWSADLVAEYFLVWLKSNNGRSAFKSIPVDQSQGLKDVAGMILHKMVLDVQFASAVFAKLSLWKAWADNGGMRRSDMEALQGDNAEDGRVQLFAFAYAAVLVALIKGASMVDVGLEGGTLSMDLQECLRLWRVVRLG
ncbi:hypothetical protein B0T09DRAFT_255167 [Sordaria sp. MPI-SDFR-AT-0083]|nr:hypothetical protein B0T09DRAFT_255167 [Sordaria sp. MPI-SDFR-AT-0083]